MNGPEGEASRAFWLRCLEEAPPPLALGDRTPPSPRHYEANTLHTRLEASLCRQLRERARQHAATAFQVLLAALSAMLYRVGGQNRFVVCIPYASQSLDRHGPLMADGVLDLPLLIDCEETDTGASLLGRVRSRLIDALHHPLVTQGSIARALGHASAGDRPALTGIFFNLNPKVDLTAYAPLKARMQESRKAGILSELFFNFYEHDDVITLDLHYSTEHFSPERARFLVESLVASCEALASAVDEPLARARDDAAAGEPDSGRLRGPGCPALDPRLVAWNATDAELSHDASVEQWFRDQVRLAPQAVALIAGRVEMTYGELEARSNRFAHALLAHGAGPGTRVGLCLGRGPDLVAALLGVLKTGAAYVPLDPGFPRDRLLYMAEDAGVKVVVTERVHAHACGVPRELQLRIDDDADALAQASPSPVAPPREHAGDATAYVIYTSGSTGRPKGVVVPRRAVCNFLASMKREPGLGRDDRLLAVTTLSFDIAVLELLLPLVVGAQVVLAEREEAMDGEALAQLIHKHRITVMQATPTTWHLLLDTGWRAPAGFKALCGGEPLPASLAERLLRQGVELWNMYGPTETTVWSTVARITDASRKITVGRPIDNTQVWVMDSGMRPCAVGEEGEICIGGAGVATGYFNRPELTAEKFVPDPFATRPGARLYRTGDLGRWLEDGTIEHLGRLDHQVKIRGYRIELGEIEAQLEALDNVRRAVVTVGEDASGGLRLVAYVIPGDHASFDDAGIRAALKTSLPDYMVPAQFVVLDRFPLLPNGKIDRKALPAAAGGLPAPAPAREQPVAATAEQTVTAEQIGQIMGEILGRPPLEPDDHFFELGGHSLLAARLASRVGRLAGQRVLLKTLFQSPTPHALATALRAAPSDQARQLPPVLPRPDQDTAPMSLMQQRLWFLEQLHPGTPVHNLPSAHRLKGPMNLAALEAALAGLVQRQSVLRTYFERTPEAEAVQRVLPSLEVRLPLVDLSGVPAQEREHVLQEHIARMAKTPIALERPPLFRLQLFCMDEQEHVLFFMAHHAIWDGWSFDLLYLELSELYAAHCDGREPRLPSLSVTYGDFSVWQRKWMQDAELARQTHYWKSHLTPLPEPLELPLDRPRPPLMSGRGASHRHLLPRELADRLHAFARQRGKTLYVVLLAAYGLLLHRMTGQSDFVVGTPVRGREQPELEPVMGFFVNALPLRLRPAPDLSFSRWLDDVHDVVTNALAYPEVPFEHLVRELNVPRDPSRPVLYQSMFSFQDARERRLQWGRLTHQRTGIGLHGASEDFSLWCVETPAGIECAYTYAADLFCHETVVSFALRFHDVLEQVTAEAETALSRYRMLTQADQDRLSAWNDTAQDVKQECVHTLLAPSFERHAQSCAVATSTERCSYAELDEKSNRLAHELRAHGAARGSLVGLCLPRGLDMLVAQLAILKCGAAYVPLDPAFPAERLAYMADDAQLALLVTSSPLAGLLPWPRERSVLLDIDTPRIERHPSTALPRDERSARPEDPAYVIYTSGSTGRPKGVVVPHRAVVNFLLSMAREPGLAPSDRLLAVTTLSFDIAVLELLLPLAVGAQIVMASRDEAMDGQALHALLLSSQATVMQATPSTWRMLLEAGWQGSASFKALIGGEPLPADLAEQLLARTGELWNMYGPTETTVWSTCGRVSSLHSGISIGRPIANTQVHILDERGQPCPIGVPGEICIGGLGLASGYWRRPELTAERFIDDPQRPGHRLYRTGDRGRWRHDGWLEHQGRLDSQVKLRGYRIELGEIEAQLASHPGVARCVVALREDHPGDARLLAYVVPDGPAPQPAALREHLRRTLPEYMLPQHFVMLEAIPLLPNGKIDRKALPAPPSAARSTAAASLVPPTTAAEIAIAEVWQRLLGIEHVSCSDNFFDLGGHSLLAMRAASDIEARLGVRLPVRRLIFESLSQIAAACSPAPPPSPPSYRRPWLARVLHAMSGRVSGPEPS